jgi:hypothetical protein
MSKSGWMWPVVNMALAGVVYGGMVALVVLRIVG